MWLSVKGHSTNRHPSQITPEQTSDILSISKYLRVGRLLVSAHLVKLSKKKAFKPSHQVWWYSHFLSKSVPGLLHNNCSAAAFSSFTPAAAYFCILLPVYSMEEGLCDLYFSYVISDRTKTKIAVIKWKNIAVYMCIYTSICFLFRHSIELLLSRTSIQLNGSHILLLCPMSSATKEQILSETSDIPINKTTRPTLQYVQFLPWCTGH